METDSKGESTDTVDKEISPVNRVAPAFQEAKVSSSEPSTDKDTGEKSLAADMQAPAESETADSRPELQSCEEPNPFGQLQGLSNLMSQLMPGFDQDAGFDVREMREIFSQGEHTGSFSSIEVQPGGKDGELTDTVPVPEDLQSIWRQMHAINLPEVILLSLKDGVDTRCMLYSRSRSCGLIFSPPVSLDIAIAIAH